jgi:hypothetical protein
LLYSSFQFNFQNPSVAHRFLTLAPAQSLCQIKDLHISYTFDDRQPELIKFDSTLAQISAIINGMSALKVLCISLYDCPQSWERQMLEPLMRIRIPNGKFVVKLPLPRYPDEGNVACTRADEQLPFVIERINTYSANSEIEMPIERADVYSHPGRRFSIWWTICCFPCALVFVLVDICSHVAQKTVRWVKKHSRSRNATTKVVL